MERLDGEVRRSLRGAGVSDAGVLAAVVRVWPEVVGDAIARAAWPARIARDGTLHVHAVSATWAFELGRLAPEIHQRLAAALGEDAPAALRFAPGPVPAPGAPEPPSDAATPPHPDAEEARRAASVAAAIEDAELREIVRRAAAASFASARSGRSF